jgi:hypothetical protein
MYLFDKLKVKERFVGLVRKLKCAMCCADRNRKRIYLRIADEGDYLIGVGQEEFSRNGLLCPVSVL